MRLNKEKPSPRVTRLPDYVESDWRGKGNRERPEGANPDGKRSNERIYKTPEFRRAIEDISSEFQSRTRTDGKGSRPDPMSEVRRALRSRMQRSKSN